MKCEKCGEVCLCPMEPPPIESPAPDQSPVPGGTPTLDHASDVATATADSDSWRNELSARLSHYRARRKAPPPRYPSLRLPFGQAGSALRLPPLEDPLPTHEI